MRFGSKGPAVKKMQQKLLSFGYELPKYGADGDLGDETIAALKEYAKDRSLAWDIQIPPNVIVDLNKRDVSTMYGTPLLTPVDVMEDELFEIKDDQVVSDVRVYDLRTEQSNPPEKYGKFKIVDGEVLVRDPANIIGITIHQTAVEYDVVDYQVEAAQGDRQLALARRSLDIACHMIAFRAGFIAWPNPLEWYIHHGNGFNPYELGLEIDGNYSGVIGGDTWNGKKATKVTDKLVGAARAALKLMVDEGRKLGMPLQYIHAHRQSSSKRRGDPGEELWKRVVLEFAVPVLGLETQPDHTIGSGKSIPKEWDSDGVGSY